jgi:DNA-directed RNA polymerase specialized sigma subunit
MLENLANVTYIKLMDSLPDKVLNYQKLLKKERLELLRIKEVRTQLVDILVELQEPTYNRRISAKGVAYLIAKVQEEPTNPIEFYDEIIALKVKMEAWTRLENAALKGDCIDWKPLHQDTLKLRDELLIETIHLVKDVRRMRIQCSPNHYLDVESAGLFGLFRSFILYSPVHNRDFEAYAKDTIYYAMLTFLTTNNAIRLSGKMIRYLREFKRAEEELTINLGREPDEEELRKKMGLSEAEMNEITHAKGNVLSMDAPASEEDEGGGLHDLIGEEDSLPFDRYERKSVLDEMVNCLKKLPKLQADFAALRWQFTTESKIKGVAKPAQNAVAVMRDMAYLRLKAARS